jgi:hypothetical protein
MSLLLWQYSLILLMYTDHYAALLTGAAQYLQLRLLTIQRMHCLYACCLMFVCITQVLLDCPLYAVLHSSSGVYYAHCLCQQVSTKHQSHCIVALQLCRACRTTVSTKQQYMKHCYSCMKICLKLALLQLPF